MRLKRNFTVAMLAASALLFTSVAQAKLTAEEVARLGKDLTPWGAEKAGNADGTIPEYTGGLTEAPAGWKGPGNRYVDPYADEKVLFSITRENVSQYADKLTPAQQKMFEKYDGYRMDIYPSHRTHNLPQFVIDNTLKNAANVETADGGDSVHGVHAMVPFPIPKTGHEAMWNHLLRFQGKGSTYDYTGVLVTPKKIMGDITGGVFNDYYPYYAAADAKAAGGEYWWLFINAERPARSKGEVLLLKDALDAIKTPRRAWSYLPGMRRVRRAPTIAYDTPSSVLSGMQTQDDAYGFNGALDRFDWKLIGKKEIYVPYNSYKMEDVENVSFKEQYLPYYINPDFVRNELHRVWVIEATLKDGKRHIYKKKRYYLDEDSWVLLAGEMYDGQGELWRSVTNYTVAAYDLPGVVARGFRLADFPSDSYGLQAIFNGIKEGKLPNYTAIKPAAHFTPASVRRNAKR